MDPEPGMCNSLGRVISVHASVPSSIAVLQEKRSQAPNKLNSLNPTPYSIHNPIHP